VQVPADRGKRYGDDRDVEYDHELTDARDGQNQPGVGMMTSARRVWPTRLRRAGLRRAGLLAVHRCGGMDLYMGHVYHD
jgi:hypothetical protein